MKFLKTWAAVALLVIVSAVSFKGGMEYEAYYYNYDDLFSNYRVVKEDAERMSDLIRCYHDYISTDSITKKCSIFPELERLYLSDSIIGRKVNIEKYSYCY